jgi:hypothetical protein
LKSFIGGKPGELTLRGCDGLLQPLDLASELVSFQAYSVELASIAV